MFLNQREFVGGEGLVLIDVAEGRHEWADHHLRVVVEEVDLRIKKKVQVAVHCCKGT